MASGCDCFQVGDVQIGNLPFKCVEGDYAPQWGDWHTNEMDDVMIRDPDPNNPPVRHIQFQRTVSFQLVGVHDFVKRLVLDEAPQVYGFADGEI